MSKRETRFGQVCAIRQRADEPRTTWDLDESVAFYERREGLQPAEKVLFARYLRSSWSVLDLGVGAGRTTAFLADGRSYVGVDITPAMVAACRAKYPDLDIRVGDAADLSWCPSHSVDAVVFSYNGLDYLYPDAARRSALSEVARVLRSGGIFIFSRHDPWGGVGRRRFARALQLWSGAGYALDRVTGGLQTTHFATPRRVTHELNEHGLAVLDIIKAGPGTRPAWWYYAAVASSMAYRG